MLPSTGKTSLESKLENSQSWPHAKLTLMPTHVPQCDRIQLKSCTILKETNVTRTDLVCSFQNKAANFHLNNLTVGLLAQND